MASVRERARAFRWRGRTRRGTGRRRRSHGTARLGRKTKDLVKRLRDGDIAIIDHADLDRIAAEDLAASGVARPSSTSPGPRRAATQTPVRWCSPGLGSGWSTRRPRPLFEELHDGDEIVVDGGEVRRDGDLLVAGEALEVAALEERMAEQLERVDEAIEAFARNTIAFGSARRASSSPARSSLPQTRTSFRDRHVLIVVRGTTYRRDLNALRAYIQDVQPILVGVDGGADAIIEAGLRPDVDPRRHGLGQRRARSAAGPR